MSTQNPNKERERKRKKPDIINSTIILRQSYVFSFFSQVNSE